MIFGGYFFYRVIEIIPPSQTQFIHFYFQLFEIKFRFVENVNFYVSKNRVQLNGLRITRLKYRR